VLPRLEELALAEPLDERVAAQLMLARDRCGRRADALGLYVAFRRRLAEELGADPRPGPPAVHQAIPRATPAEPPAPAPRPPPPHVGPAARAAGPAVGNGAVAPPVPAQLPAAAAAFTGRHAELAVLDAILAAADRPALVSRPDAGSEGNPSNRGGLDGRDSLTRGSRRSNGSRSD